MMSVHRKTSLFVDDEPGVLQAMRRMLRPLRHEWNMSFVGSGQDCLDLLSHDPQDVVVTDMRMPGMNGMQLLTNVAAQHPHIVRIVLSGQADRDTVIHAVEPTHQYLAKPCQADVLRSTISRATALASLLTDNALQGIIARATRIPSIPSVYNEVSQSLSQDDVSLEEVGNIISRDVAMTAKLLKFVNSEFFGVPRKVESAGEAANVLGLELMKSLVFNIEIFSQFEHLDFPGFCIHRFERHSHNTGMIAKAIATAECGDAQVAADAYLGGFMHDIGKLVLIENMPEQYREVMLAAAQGTQPLHEVEREMLGASHAAVGAYLLGIWGLPADIVEAIAFHHTPADLPEPSFRPLTAVHAANVLDHELNGQTAPGTAALDHDWLKQLGLDGRCAEWRRLAASIELESADV